MSKSTTIRQALQHVADYPTPIDDHTINMPVHELVCRTLFDISNRPDAAIRGSHTRANKARKLILDRLAGKRRAGTSPHMAQDVSLEFFDLTGGELSGKETAAEEIL